MLKGMNDEQKIWNFLSSKGLNDFAVAGIMGNLYAESELRPNNLQNTYEKKLGMSDGEYTAAVDSGKYTNFIKDCAGYGLAQWTYWSRKQNLHNFAKDARKSIGDLEMQLDFLWKELQGYTGLMKTLKAATSVFFASTAVLTQYERPANQGESAKKTRCSYGQKYYDKYATKTESKKEETSMSTKITTGKQLAERAIDVAKNYKTLYVMGCFGAPMNSANKARYCKNHSYNMNATRQAMIKAASADTFGFDCVCLIKGLLWGWNGDTSKTYGGAGYAVNGVPDIGADTMITKCSGISTDFSKIEVGEAVWMEGHIGIYVGGGLAVECTPKWENKVQITACNCSVSGYNRRNWTKHGKLPYVSYTGASEQPSKPTQPSGTAGKLKVGDIVEFTGNTHYANAGAAKGSPCKPGRAKVTATFNGKHPYHLIAENSGGSTVYGWVNASDIKGTTQTSSDQKPTAAKETVYIVVNGDTLSKIASKYGTTYQKLAEYNGIANPNVISVGQKIRIPNAAAQPTTPWTPKVGDVVNYSGSIHYANATATSGHACKGGKAKITAIYQLGKSKHPYHLVRVSGSGATVYGWVNAGTFTKA